MRDPPATSAVKRVTIPYYSWLVRLHRSCQLFLFPALVEPDLPEIAGKLWIISPLPALIRALNGTVQEQGREFPRLCYLVDLFVIKLAQSFRITRGTVNEGVPEFDEKLEVSVHDRTRLLKQRQPPHLAL